MGLDTLERRVSRPITSAPEFSEPVFEAAISTEEYRVALNGLTKRKIVEARKNHEKLRFTSKGVDALGTAKRYIKNRRQFGNHDPRTKTAERVFEYDILTGLFEETESVHNFSVEYPVIDGRVEMGEFNWEELAANGLLDDSVEIWYQDRAFAEAREAVLVGAYLKEGILEENDIITISNTSTAKNARDYFSGEDLMVRHISYNQLTQKVKIDTLKMCRLENKIIQELYNTLAIPVDEKTIQGSEDESVKYLASQIKVKKGELQNGSADIGFMLDWLASRMTGRLHLFGRPVEAVSGNPYAEIYRNSRLKEQRRQAAAQDLKKQFITFAQKGYVNKDQLRVAFEEARSQVADLEGTAFVSERYGEAAAKDFQEKQEAKSRGDWAGVANAEANMQTSMGNVVICNTVMDASKNQNTNSNNQDNILNELFCPRLPKPGEVAKCPCCRKLVRVLGTAEKIACSTPKCTLEDNKLRSKRQKYEREAILQKERAKKKLNHKISKPKAKHEKL